MFRIVPGGLSDRWERRKERLDTLKSYLGSGYLSNELICWVVRLVYLVVLHCRTEDDSGSNDVVGDMDVELNRMKILDRQKTILGLTIPCCAYVTRYVYLVKTIKNIFV